MLREKALTKKQNSIVDELNKCKPRHIILEGAVRSGKTFLGILLWLKVVSKQKGKLFIMTGQTISSLKRNVLDEISNLTGEDTHLSVNNEFRLYGNRIACFGSDKSDSFKSMRGLTASGWYANEVILSHQNTVLEAFARCSDKDSKIIWETNPDKPTHYIKTNYIDRSGIKLQDGSYNILSYHFELEDNTHLDKNYIESLKAAIPVGTIYDRQIKGLWKATDQAVYTHYKITANIDGGIIETIYGIDFGYTNPCAFVRIDRTDKGLFIKGLFHQSHLTTNEMIEKIKEHDVGDSPIYCDTAEPDKIYAMRQAGLNAFESDKGPGSVINGINAVKEFDVYLLNSDIDLIRSVENYEFRKTASGEVLEEPVKHYDHYPDAFRMPIYTHYKRGVKNTDISGGCTIKDEWVS